MINFQNTKIKLFLRLLFGFRIYVTYIFTFPHNFDLGNPLISVRELFSNIPHSGGSFSAGKQRDARNKFRRLSEYGGAQQFITFITFYAAVP